MSFLRHLAEQILYFFGETEDLNVIKKQSRKSLRRKSQVFCELFWPISFRNRMLGYGITIALIPIIVFCLTRQHPENFSLSPPFLLLSFLFFPLGIFDGIKNIFNLSTHGDTFNLGIVRFIALLLLGWGIYIAHAIFFFTSKRKRTFWILAILFLGLLILNTKGCLRILNTSHSNGP